MAKALHSIKLMILLSSLFILAACTTGFEDRGNIPLSSFTKAKLSGMGSSPGAPMIIRIFKQSSELEVWKQVKASGKFELFRSYKICAWSGEVGPKFREGDRQSPEGFYEVTPGHMNPRSNYFLSFNLGFPNKFDRSHGRTGSNLMVHGDCSSRGCYAMTDDQIGEIYALVRESHKGGNRSVQVQVYPFRMNGKNLAKFANSEHMDFWKNIKEGHDIFEITKTKPKWDVCQGDYSFNRSGACGASTLDPTVVAALKARQAQDEAAFKEARANIKQAKLDEVAAAQAKVEAKQALEERNEKITGWFGSLFGGGDNSSDNGAGQTDPNAPTPPARN
ncbi:L,D-transpeptidase family protein [Maritalea sp. S77]|uniref:L,D-transpeptidase family protein n=1 Tax=Maritalea sp. S77 TaxID=3415125 RepID=UPI003C7BB1A1